MNFSQALEQLKSHCSIRRKNWSGDKYIFLVDKPFGFLPFIAIHTKDGNLGFIQQQIAICLLMIGKLFL